jgi:nicotinamide mononucleotide (NMN) deamidase PncC
MYAANPSGNVTSAPLATIAGALTGIAGPFGVALDSSGRIYVANYYNSTVTGFAANPSGNVTSAPITTITGITNAWGMAIR